MSAASYDIVVERYTAWRQEFMYKDPDDKPIDLTGVKARMQVRPRMDSDDVLLELTDADGIELGGVDGTLALVADEATTGSWDFRSAVYDIKLDDERWLEGDFRVTPGVTHD